MSAFGGAIAAVEAAAAAKLSGAAAVHQLEEPPVIQNGDRIMRIPAIEL